MWLYNGNEISSLEDCPSDAIGFVYKVTHNPSGKKYIGKKILHNKKKLPPLKGKKRKRIVVKESDWKTYYGSSDEVKELLKETHESDWKREILKFCTNKKQMSYWETKIQFAYGVLESDIYLNANIAGKWFRRDI